VYPLGMGTEIERTFIVFQEKLPPLKLGQAVHIEQAFLSENPCIRLRLKTYREGSAAFVTIKGPGLIQRDEWEWKVPLKDVQEIMERGLWHSALVKKRYVLGRWEVNQFLGVLEGLWLTEIELSSPTESFDKPEWLGREVTENPAFTNMALARDGIPDGV
jgi:adenylate cyclase